MNTLDSAEVKGYAYEAAGAEAVRAAFDCWFCMRYRFYRNQG